MKACAVIVTAIAGLGTQTVTGVVDALGAPFTGLGAVIYGNSALNTLQYSTGATVPGFRGSFGIDDGSAYRRGTGMETVLQSGGKISDIGQSNTYSILDEKAQLAFGGAIARKAYISAFRSGEFDITYDLNDRTGDSFLVLVFGGSDLSVGMVNSTATISSLSFSPLALLVMAALNNATTTGTGTSNFIHGWDTQLSGKGFTIVGSINQSGNFRGQRSDRCGGQETGAYPALSYNLLTSVSSWDVAGVHYSASGPPGGTTLFFGGSTIQAAAGTLTQPGSTGLQETVVGFYPALVILMSVGITPSTSVAIDQAELCHGILDGTRGYSRWTGETTIGNVGSVKGARYLSDSDVLRFAAANGASTSFTAKASAAGFSSVNNSFSLDWTLVDGTSREVLWFALGLGDIPPPILPNGCVSGMPLRAVTGHNGCALTGEFETPTKHYRS